VLTLEQRKEVRQEAVDVLQDYIKAGKRILIAFVSGLTLFFALGIVCRENILQPILKFIYPPTSMYADIKTELLADSGMQRQLAQGHDLKEALFEVPNTAVKLESFPTIKGQLPPEIWHTMKAGNKETYLELLESSGFPDALKAKYYKDLLLTYEVHKPYNEELIIKNVLEKGKISLRCKIEMVGTALEGQDTNFGIPFYHGKQEAIVVIPRKAHENTYSWLRRPRSNFPWLYIHIAHQETAVDMVKVVGIERTGKEDCLVIRI
ncbi:hypothetical protein ACFL6U_24370, partial [Planctomycetota bacterium]